MNTALQLFNGELSLITKPLPKLSSPKDVMIKVTYSGICGTDLSIIKGDFPAAKKVVQGHEFSGVIHEVGNAVKHLKVGDRVCVNPYDYCSVCHYCVRGQPQFCVNDGMKTAVGFKKDGGWQEYVLLPSHLCFPVPSTMSLKESIFCQPLSNLVHGWNNMGTVDHDAKILVAGAGMAGLLWASMFHYHGYRDVTISESSENRKKMAATLDLGFSVKHPNDLNEQWEKAVEEKDETWGFDVIVDCTGEKSAIEYAFKWLRKGATMVFFGVVGQETNVSFEPYQIYSKEITIVSSYLNPFCYSQTVNLLHNMSERYLDLKKLGIVIYSLHDYEAAFAALKQFEITKAVFKF